MAPRLKFTRDEMVSAALEVVRKRGMGELTAKALAEELGTSTQPVFTCFGTMEALRADVLDAAEAVFDGYINKGLQSDLPFFGFGTQYVRFAKEKPELYRMLFLSSLGKNGAYRTMQHAAASALPALMRFYRLSQEHAQRYFRDVWLAVHGLASLVVTESCPYSDAEIGQILAGISVSICKAIKEIPGYAENSFDRDAVFNTLIRE